ncbi:MAG: hypothetical protein PHW12_00335 [Smithella sp.]|nr:hypothetical protein [Smithella sp.]
MPLSWNEIKDRALAYSKRWQGETSEDANAKSFWDEFFIVFGVDRKRVATFERKVNLTGERQGYIDLLWKGVILVEHKSRGKDLDRAYQQATDYFPGLKDYELPRFILVCDFEHFRLYDLDDNTQSSFVLADLYKNVKLFGFLIGYQTKTFKPQDPANIIAAEKMGKLHDRLRTIGYEGHQLELYLVRLLFCLFAEDTGIFEKQQFQDFISQKTNVDGSDIAAHLVELFAVLNTVRDKRFKNLDEHLALFPYVNGKLFAETLPIASFDRAMRYILFECSALDWSKISPAIFGSLFQSVMDPVARRNLGGHYTSEKNILKVVHGLFLDDLRAEFESIKGNRKKLEEFHKKLGKLTFLDPACGCGNFLVITYRELRQLEIEVLRELYKGQQATHIEAIVWVDISQFYGIEIEEFPARIAEVAMWLIDHQMNMKISEEFGQYFVRLPLKKTANIINDNALRIEWPVTDYILGNPPFVGSKMMSEGQRADLLLVADDLKNAGVLDFVTAWYLKASKMIEGTKSRVAFVSTNSICQGEQVGILWGELLGRRKMQIHFAHRTFRWNNEAKGVAAVYCVIVGFGAEDIKEKVIWEYPDITGEPAMIAAKEINGYLVDGPMIILPNRNLPLCICPEIGIGNKPIDDGNYLFSKDEKKAFCEIEPDARSLFYLWVGAEEFLNGGERWVLLVQKANPSELKKMPEVLKRINAVKNYRLKSSSASTRKLASVPTRFHVENFPETTYLVIPEVSSERRYYLPIGFMNPKTIPSNLVKITSSATLYHFGVLHSLMHNAWMRVVAGRLEGRYRYSSGIDYNNFPWPNSPTEQHKSKIESCAQAILDSRVKYPKSTLADLYDPLTMPIDLLKAHQALDKAVDAAYGKKEFNSEGERVAFLFELYQKYLTPLLPELGKMRKRRIKT